MLPPIPYPIGLIVALNPSSEFLFSSATITLIATAIFFLPMMPYVFLLPLVSVYGVTVRDGFSVLHARPFRVWAGQAGGLLTKATGLWIALILAVFVFSGFMGRTGLLNSLGFGIWWGRWFIPLEMAGFAAIILGPFPGIISVAFQRGRVSTLRGILGSPALEDKFKKT